MIPNVEDILRMLKSGECSHEQAMAWMELHFMQAEIEAVNKWSTDAETLAAKWRKFRESLKEGSVEPCCGEYKTCNRPCTPRGRFSVMSLAPPSYVATLPDDCDRVVWRGHYYHLPDMASCDDSPTD